MGYDKDLSSIQEVRDLLKKAGIAQKKFMSYSQEEVDKIVRSMVEAGYENAEKLAKMAVNETGFGKVNDKIIKNIFATKGLYDSIKGLKTVGIIERDDIKKVYKIAEPMGIVAAIIPSTNPTSTAMYKSIISVKSRNAVVISPHPKALNCTFEAARIMEQAAVKAGAPEGLICCMSIPTAEGSRELMHNEKTGIILATGGSAMVKAAYSSGKPALGVGPGNVPAYIEKTADIPKAVKHIIQSNMFDNGVICATEQAVVCDKIIAEKVIEEFKKNKAHFLTLDEKNKLEKIILTPYGSINPQIVGKDAPTIASMAGFSVDYDTSVLIAFETRVGKEYPFSTEKLSPILAFYTVEDWHEGCELCIKLLNNGGIGHSLVIHSQDENIITEFALKKPVFRILVNTPSALGAVGATTNLFPAFTLGCGTWGGSATSENVTPLHLLNYKYLAYGVREVEEFEYQRHPNELLTKQQDEAVYEYNEIDLDKIISKYLSGNK